MRRHAMALSVAVLLAVALTGGSAQADEEDAGAMAAVAHYKVDITGAPRGVEGLMKTASQLLALRNRPPATVAALRRRVAADEDRFRDVLESQGYYDGQVESSLTPNGDTVAVKITVKPGLRYTIASLALKLDRDLASAQVLQDKSYEKPLARIAGHPARAEDVIKAEDDAIAVLRDHGFAFAKRGDRDTQVDHDSHEIHIVLPVTLGPITVFGTTHFHGLTRVKESFMQRSIPWKQGALFNAGALEDLRKYFVDSGLFASVTVKPAHDANLPDGAPLDVAVDVSEGARHTVTLGVIYARDTGVGGTVGWTDRNLFGGAENLSLRLDANQLEQTATATLTEPNFITRNQTLKFNALLENFDNFDNSAYTGDSGTGSVGLEQKLGRDWIVGEATSFEVAGLTQNGVHSRSYVGGIPITLERAPLIATRSIPEYFVNQTQGWRLYVTATPYIGDYQGTVGFFNATAEGDFYLPLDERQWYVVAARLKLGTIVGAGTADIPPDKRFYAGGGGSVRGFAYQSISPLTSGGTPIGGRGLMESGVEARLRITNTIGIVPFIDAGSVSDTSLPGDHARVSVGAGIGVRYYTNVGPLRVDFAIPVNPRPGIDAGFQFYLSFGQAF